MKLLKSLPIESMLDNQRLPVCLWECESKLDKCEFGCKMNKGDLLFGTNNRVDCKFCSNCFFKKVVSGDGKTNYKLVPVIKNVV